MFLSWSHMCFVLVSQTISDCLIFKTNEKTLWCSLTKSLLQHIEQGSWNMNCLTNIIIFKYKQQYKPICLSKTSDKNTISLFSTLPQWLRTSYVAKFIGFPDPLEPDHAIYINIWMSYIHVNLTTLAQKS